MDRTIQQLADYAAGLRFEDLPPEAVHECKRRLIDTLDRLVAAFDAEPAVIARAVARRAVGDPPARILAKTWALEQLSDIGELLSLFRF